MSILYHRAIFLLSAAEIKQLPEDHGIEVAIVGRSNAGKSSVLNKLTQNKSLARVSKTPGRTQLINLFGLDQHRRIVDLPGYGYAKVPLAVKKQWEKRIEAYFQSRQSLKGLILVMDIRHPMQELDKVLLNYCAMQLLPVHILLNKADKLSKNACVNTLRQVNVSVQSLSNIASVQIFSAANGLGLKELQTKLNIWYEVVN